MSINFSSSTAPSVLVVDDEAMLGRFVCMMLRQSGYRTDTCQSVAEARHLLTKKSWNIVLTDIVMPEENGFELVQWIGQHHPEVSVILMTAHSTNAILIHANKLGVSAILQKPFTRDALNASVNQATHMTANGVMPH